MSAFIYSVTLQWKLDLRNKGILIVYYIVPLIFFALMGTVFTSINPMAKDTLIQSMSIFAITMAAIIGAPTPLVELYGSEIKKAYKVGNIPLWMAAVSNFISAFVNIFIVSLIIFVVAPIAFGAKLPSNLGLYFATLIILIIASLMIGTALGLFVKSISKLTMISQIIFLPALLLSGIMFPANMLPKSMVYVGKLFPSSHAMGIMTNSAPEVSAFLPLIVIIFLLLVINIYKLSKMKIE
ncbi:MAG TPA: ABC transporter permease [Ruminiclostridium sp.]